ncbi:glycosyl transferase [Dulcicalothrix desertica PCC 7102]|uniref:Glycosyl transferase n=1 Tax=Dulcicalothrix desertica PCC 7102 TaxID=232991 RepID=A0A3S1ARY9_9CYAN|nr:glycosyltransferase family 4 protein [Dulcicalothrix desertica]RUT07885.1 glycosyl transferase [Dulcicalothrix desertica PCC 7102]TWH39406.1 glycosyltransferase involved in cell wall biosynthesis [Dulcicalothrix desertica PCC 7102]
MNFCIVTPYVIKGDGQGRVNYEIVWEAIRRGHEVTLVARKVAPELQEQGLVKFINFDVEKFPTALIKEMMFSSQSAAWLYKHRQEFDLVQICGAVTSFPADVNTSHFVHTSWRRSHVHTARMNKNFYGLYHWLYSTLNAYWEKQAYQKAKISVAVSNKVKQELINDVNIKPEKIHVIHNGVDVNEFFPGVSDRQQLGLPVEKNLALFAGDIRTNRKNLDTVLKAIVKVPSLHLVVLGDTSDSPYPKMAENLGLSDRVYFAGFRRDVAEIMRAVDFFVLPSRYEACTLVLLEAMASGLPVITAESAGGAELVTPESGFVLASDNVNALATALNTLTLDSELRTKMGETARIVAEQNTWVSKAEHYINLFEKFVNDEHYRNCRNISSPVEQRAILKGA